MAAFSLNFDQLCPEAGGAELTGINRKAAKCIKFQ
jgi:hypothetical protein